jgi:N-acetylglucosamine-6-phosphate deacetylase
MVTKLATPDHREPGIIGLLGAAPSSQDSATIDGKHPSQSLQSASTTPMASQILSKTENLVDVESLSVTTKKETPGLIVQKPGAFRRPFWSCIADGLHVHPFAINLAYQAHPEGCIVVTDGGPF